MVVATAAATITHYEEKIAPGNVTSSVNEGGRNADYAVDGNPKTIATSGSTDSAKWMMIDLKRLHHVSHIVIYNGGRG